MQLIIAEKPSVARAIAAVVGAKQNKNDYIEGSNYLITWCVGHLIEQASTEAYDEKYAKWRLEHLPIVPNPWQYVVSANTHTQYTAIKKLMADKRIKEIVCATDAGREGELIFRLVYNQAKCKKPILRLWTSSLEETALRDGLDNLKPGSDYDSLYHAAMARAQADWLVGINATRLYSCLLKSTTNIGRVMTPTLALLVKRSNEIDNFGAQTFYIPEINCNGFIAQGERHVNQRRAEKIAEQCNGKDAVVVDVKKAVKSTAPPKLYDLTSLQRDSNRIFGHTAQQTLTAAQSLYEKKLLTYPRTDSRYITEDMAGSVSALLPTNHDITQVVDNAKVTDHHAIIPTAAAASADTNTLNQAECDVLSLVKIRLVTATADKHTYEAKEIIIECAEETFTAKGKTVINNGWKALEERCMSDIKGKSQEKPEDATEAALPPVDIGTVYEAVTVTIREGKTTPPKHYTEDTLLSAMENAGISYKDIPADLIVASMSLDESLSDDELIALSVGNVDDIPANKLSAMEALNISGSSIADLMKHRGLGTPATRAGTIEKLIKIGFIERSKKKLLPTEKGSCLIALLHETLKTPMLTAEWETKLLDIEHGNLNADTFMGGIVSMVHDLVQTVQAEFNAPAPDAPSTDSINRACNLMAFQDATDTIPIPMGDCPRCGKTVYENPKGYCCEERDCGFALWKNNRFFASQKIKLDATTVRLLLTHGEAFTEGLTSAKTGKKYDATIVLDDTGGKFVNFKLRFDNND
ncbi:MAG: DNA topoisomerase [Oscillospiraceae bacterium]|nr:DNA topoisomerase [Oscillospiraceae bacterium]